MLVHSILSKKCRLALFIIGGEESDGGYSSHIIINRDFITRWQNIYAPWRILYDNKIAAGELISSHNSLRGDFISWYPGYALLL